MTHTELLTTLIDELSEDAVFTCLTAIAVIGIENKEDAINEIERDPDCLLWALMTAKLIPS